MVVQRLQSQAQKAEIKFGSGRLGLQQGPCQVQSCRKGCTMFEGKAEYRVIEDKLPAEQARLLVRENRAGPGLKRTLSELNIGWPVGSGENRRCG